MTQPWKMIVSKERKSRSRMEKIDVPLKRKCPKCSKLMFWPKWGRTPTSVLLVMSLFALTSWAHETSTRSLDMDGSHTPGLVSLPSYTISNSKISNPPTSTSSPSIPTSSSTVSSFAASRIGTINGPRSTDDPGMAAESSFVNTENLVEQSAREIEAALNMDEEKLDSDKVTVVSHDPNLPILIKMADRVDSSKRMPQKAPHFFVLKSLVKKSKINGKSRTKKDFVMAGRNRLFSETTGIKSLGVPDNKSSIPHSDVRASTVFAMSSTGATEEPMIDRPTIIKQEQITGHLKSKEGAIVSPIKEKSQRFNDAVGIIAIADDGHDLNRNPAVVVSPAGQSGSTRIGISEKNDEANQPTEATFDTSQPTSSYRPPAVNATPVLITAAVTSPSVVAGLAAEAVSRVSGVLPSVAAVSLSGSIPSETAVPAAGAVPPAAPADPAPPSTEFTKGTKNSKMNKKETTVKSKSVTKQGTSIQKIEQSHEYRRKSAATTFQESNSCAAELASKLIRAKSSQNDGSYKIWRQGSNNKLRMTLATDNLGCTISSGLSVSSNTTSHLVLDAQVGDQILIHLDEVFVEDYSIQQQALIVTLHKSYETALRDCVVPPLATLLWNRTTNFVIDAQYLMQSGLQFFAVAVHSGDSVRVWHLRLGVYDHECTVSGTLTGSQATHISGSDAVLCSGHGVCGLAPGETTYSCRCCAYIKGRICNEFDGCASLPCRNNGFCVDITEGLGGSLFQCLCPHAFRGSTCEIAADFCEIHKPCRNNATCISGSTAVNNDTQAEYICQCPKGFEGPNCEVNIDECAPRPCVHGVCEDGMGEFKCYCLPGYGGELCEFEYDECDSSPCVNGGACEDLVAGFRCHCGPGYTGRRCEMKVDLCSPNPCAAPATCIDRGNNYTCVCRGSGCASRETRADPCYPNPCQHGGSCWPSMDTFYCSCQPGFAGDNCQEIAYPQAIAERHVFVESSSSGGVAGSRASSTGNSEQRLQQHRLHTVYIACATLAGACALVAIGVTVCQCRTSSVSAPSASIPSVGCGGVLNSEGIASAVSSAGPSSPCRHHHHVPVTPIDVAAGLAHQSVISINNGHCRNNADRMQADPDEDIPSGSENDDQPPILATASVDIGNSPPQPIRQVHRPSSLRQPMASWQRF